MLTLLFGTLPGWFFLIVLGACIYHIIADKHPRLWSPVDKGADRIAR